MFTGESHFHLHTYTLKNSAKNIKTGTSFHPIPNAQPHRYKQPSCRGRWGYFWGLASYFELGALTGKHCSTLSEISRITS